MSRRAIITGGSRGLGYSVADQLGAAGFELVLIASSQSKLDFAAERLRSAGRVVAKTIACDFANLTAVTQASSLLSSETPWSILVNNAGIKIQKDAPTSAQGFERHMAINHLAHFELTRGLISNAASDARIVTVSSIVARQAPRDIWNAQSTSDRYAASKLANLSFAIELDRRLQKSGSNNRSLAAHPGFTKADPYGTWVTRLGEILLAQRVDSGAAPIVHAALAAEPWAYTGPRVFELWGSPKQARVSDLALNQNFASELWRHSERAVGHDWQI